MSDPIPVPSTTEKTVVATSCQLKRLWYMTISSLALNFLVLALLVIGAIIHHHQQRMMAERLGPPGGQFYANGPGGFGPRFGGMGPGDNWGRHGGRGDRGDFGRGHRDGDENRDGNFGRNGGEDENGGPGFHHRNFGGNGGDDKNGGMDGGHDMGMMGGEHNGPADPAQMTDRMLNRLSHRLSLTDDEKAKIKPIIEAQATQMQKDRQAQMDARQKAMDDTKAKIKALLTPDQQKELDAMPLPGSKPPGGPGQ